MSDQRRLFSMILPNGLEGLAECRVIDVNRRELLGIGYFDNPDDFQHACREWDGRANLYAGRNPRPVRLCPPSVRNTIATGLRAASRDDIETVTMVSLDLDPVRPEGVPSSDVEQALALEEARQIAGRYAGAWVMQSGNGAQVLIPVQPLDVRGRQADFERRVRTWEEGLRRAIRRPDAVRLDSQYDLPRIIKVPGSLSVKGHATPDRPHRQARLLARSEGGNDLLKEIMEVTNVAEATDEPSGRHDVITPASSIPELFWELLQHDRRLRRTWEGHRDDFPSGRYSRSEYDLSLATQLARYGFTAQEILAILLAFPHGRNTTGTASYFALTIGEAVRPARRARTRRGTA